MAALLVVAVRALLVAGCLLVAVHLQKQLHECTESKKALSQRFLNQRARRKEDEEVQGQRILHHQALAEAAGQKASQVCAGVAFDMGVGAYSNFSACGLGADLMCLSWSNIILYIQSACNKRLMS